MPRSLFVYILASKDRKLYTGLAGNLAKRLERHRSGASSKAYTSRHGIDRLVYFERVSPENARERERQIKGWTRAKRVALIESVNPEWRDLSLSEWLDR